MGKLKTQEPKLEAGKKLNEAVAFHVLEWANHDGQWQDPVSGKDVALRPFSEDLAVAWELAEKICDLGYRLQIDGSRIWQARFYKSAAHSLATKAFSATGRTPAEAICLAALAVKGVGDSSA